MRLDSFPLVKRMSASFLMSTGLSDNGLIGNCFLGRRDVQSNER